MKASFRCSALGLALISAIVVSANAFPGSATGTAGATVMAPVTISNTTLTATSDLFVGAVTGDLTIRLPGVYAPSVDGGYLKSVASAFLEGLTNSCSPRAGTLADCFGRRDDDQLLKGDPVSSLTLDISDLVQPEKADINVTVVYN